MNALTHPVPDSARFTVADLLELSPAFEAMGARVDLDHGALHRVPPPDYRHSRLVRIIRETLARAVEGSGLTVDSEIGVRLSDDTARGVDVAVFQEPGPDERLLDAASVRLVVEVAYSSLRHDLGPKSRDYASAGIDDYWVVDGNEAVVHVMRAPVEGVYTRRDLVRFGEPLAAGCLSAAVVILA